jgi:hypothetical protein
VSRKFFELVRQSRRYGSCFGQHDVVLLLDYWLRLQAAMQFLHCAGPPPQRDYVPGSCHQLCYPACSMEWAPHARRGGSSGDGVRSEQVSKENRLGARAALSAVDTGRAAWKQRRHQWKPAADRDCGSSG